MNVWQIHQTTKNSHRFYAVTSPQNIAKPLMFRELLAVVADNGRFPNLI